ncbi:response regulator transcription factor [Spiribacter sp. 221]|uniref:response regulator transcription factor n=1 Tax=Spiribacter onubensis TaxID=3122420 RepID=UPI00349F1250
MNDPRLRDDFEPAPVLLVEDDEDLGAALVELLELSGFRVAWARSGLECYARLQSGPDFHVAVVDVGLPDQSGLVLAEYIRSNTAAGVIILTASDRIDLTAQSYELGVDLFIAKPVDNEVLIAAIRSLNRRYFQRHGDPVTGAIPPRIPSTATRPPAGEAGSGWTLNARRRLLVSPERAEIPLTAQELALLRLFADAGDETLPRAIPLQHLYGREDESAGRALDALISRLRRKIAEARDGDNPLLTEHGAGHRFADPLQFRD